MDTGTFAACAPAGDCRAQLRLEKPRNRRGTGALLRSGAGSNDASDTNAEQ